MYFVLLLLICGKNGWLVVLVIVPALVNYGKITSLN